MLMKECEVETAVVGGDSDAEERDNGGNDKEILYDKGLANVMSDKELIAMLRQQPKDVAEMRTRESFRRFFARMRKDRFEYLLRAANMEKNQKECDKKVAKRLALVNDILV